MTAVTGRHQARLHDITRPIRMSTIRRLRAARRHKRRLDPYTELAVVLAALGILFVALLYTVASRWSG